MVGLAPPILKGPTSFLMDLVAHRCSQEVGNFSDRLWGVSMILVNIDRLTSESAFARLCGVAPIPASSGQTHRMRLHHGGDRQANRSLHMIAICRLRYDQRTIDYMARRQAEGLSKKDEVRCLKRFIAREVYHDPVTDLGQKGT